MTDKPIEDQAARMTTEQCRAADRAFKAAAQACAEFAKQVREDIAEMRELEGKSFDQNSYGAGYDNGSLETAEKLCKTINGIACYWPEQPPEDA